MYQFRKLENKYNEFVNNQKESIEEKKHKLLQNFHSMNREEIESIKNFSSLYNEKLSKEIQLFDENLDRFENYENWLVHGRFI